MNHFLPNLFIPGVAKSGTTTLHDLLDSHPYICMSELKEPVYWNNVKFNNFKLKKSNGTQICFIIKMLLFLENQQHHTCFIQISS